MAPQKIVVAGASGFVGRPLCRALWDNGRREVHALSRHADSIPYAYVHVWDAATAGDWQAALEGADALINLSGANIAEKRWTAARKRELAESRLVSTKVLVDALAAAKRPPRVFLNASAVGYYGDRGDETLDESSAPGEDFLARLCADWESAALAAPKSVRAIVLRLGVVLGQGGGALGRMLLPFRLGLGGPLGSGRQYMSWISRDDAIGLMLRLLDSDASGPVNATAPEPATNEAFSRELARALGRPCVFRVPEKAARLAFGELADVLLGGQRVLPKKALAAGYAFQHPTLAQALAASLHS